MHDSVGMLYDCVSMNNKSLDALAQFHHWHSLLLLSGGIAQANAENIKKNGGDFENVDYENADEEITNFAESARAEYEKVYAQSGIEHFLEYRKKYEQNATKLSDLVADDIVNDWCALLAYDGDFSLKNILLKVFKADDQSGSSQEVPLPLTLARGEVFAGVHACIAGQAESYETLRSLFKDSKYFELVKSVLGSGGTPGLEFCRWLYEFLPFIPNSAKDGEMDKKFFHELVAAVNKRFGLGNDGYARLPRRV